MEAPNPAANSLKNVSQLFLKDLNALPEEAFAKSFGPKVRTVADIVYEVNLVQDHLGMEVRGEEAFPWPHGGWIKAPEGFSAKETVASAFAASSERLIATFEGFTPEEMEATMVTQEGNEETRAGRCRFATVHLWYHLGQLNYVQTLLGDDVWHW